MQQESQILQSYASLTNTKVIESQSDLDPKDRPIPEMVAWCRKQESIVVLQSCVILCNNPSSRVVQNCKVAMRNQGLIPGTVHPTSSHLIRILLDNAIDIDDNQPQANKLGVSTQQQRLRLLIKEAIDLEATDIHLEVRADTTHIRFRKHGELFLHAEWLPKLAREIASVAFNKETDHAITHFNPLVPQSASMPINLGNQEVRLRLASLPAHGGFDVVMRVLTGNKKETPDLLSLGYEADQVALLKKAINMPHGAVIVSGPTGSGKTTTLASCMRLINPHRKTYTIEDPVEKIVSNISQVPANTEHYDRSFASMARTVLRMDPDVVILGEMRDEDTAAVMSRAAITGHLVFSTLHTNSAVDIITRLTDLGVPRSLLASPNLLNCLICQRLAPLLCQQCAVPIKHSPDHLPHLQRWQAVIGSLDKVRGRGRSGCTSCNSQGITGRTVIAEIIWLDAKGKMFIQNGDLLGWEQHLKKHGWASYQERLLNKVKLGYCDPLDAERLIGDISLSNQYKDFHY